MDDIIREKLNIGPTLNFNERFYRQFKARNLAHT